MEQGMSKVQGIVENVRNFFQDVGSEMRKSTWPEKQELIESTIAVILSVLMLSVYIGLCDQMLVSLLKLITP